MAYPVNVGGCIRGPLVAGFWLLPWLGGRWSLTIAGLTALRKPSSGTASPKSRLNPKLKFALATLAATVLFRVSHDYETKYPVREVRRDYTATVLATEKVLIECFW